MCACVWLFCPIVQWASEPVLWAAPNFVSVIHWTVTRIMSNPEDSQPIQDILGQRLSALNISSALGEPAAIPQAFFGTRSTMLVPNAQTLAEIGKRKVVDRSEAYESELSLIEKAVEEKGLSNLSYMDVSTR